MNAVIPTPAEIIEKRPEARGISTFSVRIRDASIRRKFRFFPGQFNMLYVFGAGEIPISIVSDPEDPEVLDHTIRAVGEVSGAIERLKKGDVIGLRGPYGTGWPLEAARRHDVVIVTGGLGCAPVVSVINYIARRRADYGRLKILHGVKTPKDLLYRKRFRDWARHPDTEVILTADHPERGWKYRVGFVTNLFDEVEIGKTDSFVMICGPEIMMRLTVKGLLARALSPERIFLSMERNMKCAVGLCGRCQFGPEFVCRNGPVFPYARIRGWFETQEV